MKNFTLTLNLMALICLLVLPSCGKRRHNAHAVKKLSWSLKEHATQESASSQVKKKIIILSSTGGGGHTAAAQAIKSYLGSEKYEIEVVNVFADIIQPVDLIHYYTGVYTGEHVYDYFLQNQLIFLAETYVALGRAQIRSLAHTIESLFEDFFEQNRPDLIVSIIPIVDGAVYRVAQKLDIPFVVVPVDLDMRNYANDLDASKPEKFLFCLNFDQPEIKQHIKKIKVPEDRIRYVGFPVRQDFLHTQATPAQIKQEFGIPEDKNVIMILMGSAGSRATYRYARAFSKMRLSKPVHLIICLGRNESLRTAIEAITFPHNVSVTIMGFTQRIADLMRASDLLITKSGPTSICEAVAVGVPMIVDHTQKILWWEKMNIDFVVRHGFGDELRMMRKLPKLLKRYLDDERYPARLRERMQAFTSPQVEDNLRAVVDEALAMNDVPSAAA